MGRRRFLDRAEAGEVLAGLLPPLYPREAWILAIPNGGVAVGAAVARKNDLPLRVIIVRKVQIPWSTEAGFGAVASDGSLILNEPLLRSLSLSREEVERQVGKTRENVRIRMDRYGAFARFPAIAGKRAILVDDGLASGVTMESAARLVRRHGPVELIVAAPTASRTAVRRLEPLVDRLVCPDVRGGPVFAVADAYERWYDVPDAEVLQILRSLQSEES